jgi:hypothetical protein
VEGYERRRGNSGRKLSCYITRLWLSTLFCELRKAARNIVRIA